MVFPQFTLTKKREPLVPEMVKSLHKLKNTHKKPQEILEFKKTKLKNNFNFHEPFSFSGKWIGGNSKLQVS